MRGFINLMKPKRGVKENFCKLFYFCFPTSAVASASVSVPVLELSLLWAPMGN